MEAIKRGIAKFLFWVVYPVLRLIFPFKIKWVDKKGSIETLKSGCLIFSNHRGYVEGLLLSRVFNKYKVYTYVGKDWYEKKKINWLFRNLHYIPVDRQQMDTAWLDRGVKTVQAGNSIYILPEGHTTKTGEMDEFKPGFLILAKQAGVPLVPIYLVEKFKAFHMTHLIIGKTLNPDLNEPGRPSQVMKKHSVECRDYLIELSKMV